MRPISAQTRNKEKHRILELQRTNQWWATSTVVRWVRDPRPSSLPVVCVANLESLFTMQKKLLCWCLWSLESLKNWEQQKLTILKDTVGDCRFGGSAIVSSSNNDNKLSTLNSMMAPSLSVTNFTKDHLSLVTQYKANKPFSIHTGMVSLGNNRSPSYAATWKLMATLEQGSHNNIPLLLAGYMHPRSHVWRVSTKRTLSTECKQLDWQGRLRHPLRTRIIGERWELLPPLCIWISEGVDDNLSSVSVASWLFFVV